MKRTTPPPYRGGQGRDDEEVVELGEQLSAGLLWLLVIGLFGALIWFVCEALERLRLALGW